MSVDRDKVGGFYAVLEADQLFGPLTASRAKAIADAHLEQGYPRAKVARVMWAETRQTLERHLRGDRPVQTVFAGMPTTGLDGHDLAEAILAARLELGDVQCEGCGEWIEKSAEACVACGVRATA